MTRKRVLSVGQCAADHSAISHLVEKHFDAEVGGVDSIPEAIGKLRDDEFSLVLVNRILDGGVSPGLEFIRQIKSDESLQQIPVMLVSNYDDAQDEARQIGAEPGFGKASLGQPQMLARVKAFLA